MAPGRDEEVNRLPVVNDSGLVGREIRRNVAENALWIDPSGLQVTVEGGVASRWRPRVPSPPRTH